MSIAVLPESAPLFVEAVASSGGTVSPLGADTDAVIWLDPHDAGALEAVLRAHPTIKWVQLPFAGVDKFAYLFDPAITWTSAKAAYSEPVAEHALALTLASLRGLAARARVTSWGEESGQTLYDKNVVVIGAGGIAREFVRLVAPFRDTVTIVRRRPEPVDGVARTIATEQLASALPDADVVVVAAALTGATRSLFSTEEFAAMKPTAVIVNIARGPLVDTDALVHALESGEIAGAGIDVTDPEPLPANHPLWTAPGALVTPHTADTPEMVAPLLAARVKFNVAAFINGTPMTGVVDVEHGY